MLDFGIFLFVFFVVFAINGFWGRRTLREFHRLKPEVYARIKGPIKETFIERGYYQFPEGIGLYTRMYKEVYSKQHPEIFNPKWLTLLTLFRVVVWVGVVMFIVALLLFIATASGLASGRIL